METSRNGSFGNCEARNEAEADGLEEAGELLAAPCSLVEITKFLVAVASDMRSLRVEVQPIGLTQTLLAKLISDLPLITPPPRKSGDDSAAPKFEETQRSPTAPWSASYGCHYLRPEASRMQTRRTQLSRVSRLRAASASYDYNRARCCGADADVDTGSGLLASGVFEGGTQGRGLHIAETHCSGGRWDRLASEVVCCGHCFKLGA